MRNPLKHPERVRRLHEGARLLARGRFFKAHEAFEDLWHSTENQAEQDVWQGMAQLSAALVKHDRGEPTTAISLLAKATRRLEGTPLLKPESPGFKTWLDGLSGPITCDQDLEDPSIPEPLLAFLEGLLDRSPGGAVPGTLS